MAQQKEVQRKVLRELLLEKVGELKAALNSREPDTIKIQTIMRGVKNLMGKTLALDETILAGMMEREVTEEEIRLELRNVSEFTDAYEDVLTRFQDMKAALDEDGKSTATTSRRKSHSYRLPKLKFKEFGGDPKDWIYFWSQFRSIHEDEEMTNEEKFHYLIQATVDRSPARKVVESFPPSPENYPKAVQYLTERFGNKEVLVEVYIRSLLGIVLTQQKNDRRCLSRLYDELSTQLMSLESLEITADKYEAMLFPLVESALPEETLRCWERARISCADDVKQDKLTHLMSFLKNEVDSEERIKMAQQFQSHQSVNEENVRNEKRRPTPTTTELYSGSSASAQKPCIFCNEMHGPLSQCSVAKSMSYNDRMTFIQRKRACFRCASLDHYSFECDSKPYCTPCKTNHDVLLCPQFKNGKNSHSDPGKKSDKTLANHTVDRGGSMLLTLMVKISHNGETRMVRAAIDTGSMQSYVSKKAVEVLQFTNVGSIDLSHGLFGGAETADVHHEIYDVTVSSLDGVNEESFELLEQGKICGSLSSIPKGKWLEEFKEEGIIFSDVGYDHLDIQILFGVDTIPRVFTKEMFFSKSGLLAFGTKFGWTVLGALKTGEKLPHQALITLMNMSRDMDTLWNLETLGIRDPIEVKSEKEKCDIAMEKFRKDVTVNADGRYEVGLPWIAEHPTVADNLDVATKRLYTATKKLEKENMVSAYDKVFREWEELGIIEEFKNPAEEINVSYLPHRPVFNPSSTTTPIRPVFDASCRSKGLPALNDCLEKGENLIELVAAILCRFRLRKIGISADIKKAFLQISLKK